MNALESVLLLSPTGQQVVLAQFVKRFPVLDTGIPSLKMLLVCFLKFSHLFQKLINAPSIKMAVPLPYLIEGMSWQIPNFWLVCVHLDIRIFLPAGTGRIVQI